MYCGKAGSSGALQYAKARFTRQTFWDMKSRFGFRLGLHGWLWRWLDRGRRDRRVCGKRHQFQLAPRYEILVSAVEVRNSDGQAVLIKEFSKRVEILWRFLEEKMAVVSRKQSHLYRFV